MGKIFIILGIVFILIGFFLVFFKNFPLFHLPGDIIIQKENFSFYFPITSMILISIVLSFIFNILNKF
jgi:membrane-bound ClpP family serine protease